MKKFLLGSFLFLFIVTEYALAQDATAGQCSNFVCVALKNFPQVNAWLLAIFTFIGLTLRAAADLIAFIGEQIENKSTTDLGVKINDYALKVAAIVGWFGGGTPKKVLDAKIEKALQNSSDAPIGQQK